MILNSSNPRELPAFARKAGSYDAHATVQADAARWLAEWLPQDTAQASCLELGAGTGLFSQYLAGRFQQLECSDISPEMLEHCKLRVPEAECRVLDAWEEPSSIEPRWDFLTSCSLLQWADRPETALNNWSARVEHGGRLLLGFFVAPSLPELDQVLGGDSPVRWRSPEQWREAISASALGLMRMESKTHHYHYPTALDFWRSLHGTGSNVSRRLPVGELRRLLRAYQSAFKTDSGVRATWTHCRVELQVS